MLTQEEKKFLLNLLNNVQVQGTRQTIGQTVEKIDALIHKIEQLPTQDETPGKHGPAQKKK